MRSSARGEASRAQEATGTTYRALTRIRLELLAGVSHQDRAALARGLSALPLLRPSSETWELVERWVPAAADKGFRFGLADWLVTALANEIDALIWSLDEDFMQLEKLKMARLYSI